jgi:predicted anti-sigma-YlaC factor YlaD
MRCRQARKLVSLYVDGDLAPRRAAELELHLESCAGCRSLLGDFQAIAGAAAGLDAGEPSAAVWERIRAGVAEAARSNAGEPGFAGSRDVSRERRTLWTGPAWLRWAGATASAFILVALGVFIGMRLDKGGPAAASVGKGGVREVTARLDEAERYYQQAVRSLGQAFAAAKGDFPAEVVEVFEKNLAVVDGTIAACRKAVAQAPDNVELRNFLLAAYMDKVNLLDSALSLRPVAASGGSERTGLGKL